MELLQARKSIKQMRGKYRIPDLLKKEEKQTVFDLIGEVLKK